MQLPPSDIQIYLYLRAMEVQAEGNFTEGGFVKWNSSAVTDTQRYFLGPHRISQNIHIVLWNCFYWRVWKPATTPKVRSGSEIAAKHLSTARTVPCKMLWKMVHVTLQIILWKRIEEALDWITLPKYLYCFVFWSLLNDSFCLPHQVTVFVRAESQSQA